MCARSSVPESTCRFYDGLRGHFFPQAKPQRKNLDHRRERLRHAFTLIEVVFAMGIVGLLIVALYAAIAMSATTVRMCQENESVTQMLSEKLDTIRLYNWSQVTNDSFLPKTFTVGIDPSDPNSRSYYTGTIAVAQAPIDEPYRTNLLQVTITMDWVSGGTRPQSRMMETYIAKDGIQTYTIR
jgi:prepilin-type N-terminal cleavage/methylation domain-containing protein